MTMLPAPVTVKVLPLMVPVPVLLASMVNTTARPELAVALRLIC